MVTSISASPSVSVCMYPAFPWMMSENDAVIASSLKFISCLTFWIDSIFCDAVDSSLCLLFLKIDWICGISIVLFSVCMGAVTSGVRSCILSMASIACAVTVSMGSSIKL